MSFSVFVSVFTQPLSLSEFQEGLQVIGKCGGRCGTCSPDEVGLQVETVKGKTSLFINVFNKLLKIHVKLSRCSTPLRSHADFRKDVAK